MTDNQKWRQRFSDVLRIAMDLFSIRNEDIADGNFDLSTVIKWKNGERLPNNSSISLISNALEKRINAVDNNYLFTTSCLRLKEVFDPDSFNDLKAIKDSCGISSFKLFDAVLRFCLSNARAAKVGKDFNKRAEIRTQNSHIWVKAVFFDFDGTLTINTSNKTTWEEIWVALGYDVGLCRKYHAMYLNGVINHEKWCSITESFFKQKSLHRETVELIADKIVLINGIEEVLRFLNQSNVKVYIVSGSIAQIIKRAMGNNFQYIDGMRANNFYFDEAGYLERIVGTRYDFEGKADYIKHVSEEDGLPIKKMLFIGNSVNDQFVYKSGVKTLCINPKETNSENRLIWNNSIESCVDLRQILPFLSK